MTSSSADCTLAGARLISSASRKLAKTGPSSVSKRPVSGRQMRVPTRSAGTRSGVNWMRVNVPPSTRASVRTVSVLARPGTPSSNTWPPASRLTSSRSSIASWPTMTRLISYSASSSAARGSSRWMVGSSISGIAGLGLLRISDEAAEPAQRHRRAEQQQGEPATGEAGGDLALLLLGPQQRAEALVDVLELVRVGGGVGLAARRLGDLSQRPRVGRDLARLGSAGAAGPRDGDRPLRGAQGDGVDGDAQLARRLGRVDR